MREYHNGQRIERLTTNAAGSQLLTATESSLQLWRVDTFAELLAWAESNRYITDLTCEEAANYLIESSCEE